MSSKNKRTWAVRIICIIIAAVMILGICASVRGGSARLGEILEEEAYAEGSGENTNEYDAGEEDKYGSETEDEDVLAEDGSPDKKSDAEEPDAEVPEEAGEEEPDASAEDGGEEEDAGEASESSEDAESADTEDTEDAVLSENKEEEQVGEPDAAAGTEDADVNTEDAASFREKGTENADEQEAPAEAASGGDEITPGALEMTEEEKPAEDEAAAVTEEPADEAFVPEETVETASAAEDAPAEEAPVMMFKALAAPKMQTASEEMSAPVSFAESAPVSLAEAEQAPQALAEAAQTMEEQENSQVLLAPGIDIIGGGTTKEEESQDVPGGDNTDGSGQDAQPSGGGSPSDTTPSGGGQAPSGKDIVDTSDSTEINLYIFCMTAAGMVLVFAGYILLLVRRRDSRIRYRQEREAFRNSL